MDIRMDNKTNHVFGKLFPMLGGALWEALKTTYFDKNTYRMNCKRFTEFAKLLLDQNELSGNVASAQENVFWVCVGVLLPDNFRVV